MNIKSEGKNQDTANFNHWVKARQDNDRKHLAVVSKFKTKCYNRLL